MKEPFVNKRFGAEATAMIETINSILDDYESMGYDLSLRQLYYQLVSRNIVPNTEKSYKNIGTLVSDARLAGHIDWAMIQDRGRTVEKNPHWDNPSDFLEAVAPQYRFDLWADQPAYVEVMVEKQALEGVLLPVCRDLDVPFTANKGYSSSSAMYEASQRYLKRRDEGKELFVIYLGDHDPSGIDMTRDVGDRLDLFLGQESSVGVMRIALNMSQVEKLKPPENPAKLTDSRAKGYISKFGRSSWELDAIEPRMLATLVRSAIELIVDKPRFNRNATRMKAQRVELLEYASKMRKE